MLTSCEIKPKWLKTWKRRNLLVCPLFDIREIEKTLKTEKEKDSSRFQRKYLPKCPRVQKIKCQTITFSYTKWSLERCMFSPEMITSDECWRLQLEEIPSSFRNSNWHHHPLPLSWNPGYPGSTFIQGFSPKNLKNGEIRQIHQNLR